MDIGWILDPQNHPCKEARLNLALSQSYSITKTYKNCFQLASLTPSFWGGALRLGALWRFVLGRKFLVLLKPPTKLQFRLRFAMGPNWRLKGAKMKYAEI